MKQYITPNISLKHYETINNTWTSMAKQALTLFFLERSQHENSKFSGQEVHEKLCKEQISRDFCDS